VTEVERVRELGSRAQDNLFNFLQLELDLGRTMIGLAKTTRSTDYRRRLLDKVRLIIKTIRHFERRINDRDLRSRIHQGADLLKRLLKDQIPPKQLVGRWPGLIIWAMVLEPIPLYGAAIANQCGSSITHCFGLWVDDFGTGSTNEYYSWFDSEGVRRVKEDNSCNA
jgi:hypothetical protein